MNQPIHILKKDARHLWPELLVSLLLLIAMTWVAPLTWVSARPTEATQATPWLFPVVGGFIRFLIPITWAVILSRLVHDEPLVGDRQYWITRPYTWYSLLFSKLLFIAVFLLLPLLLVQIWLLHHVGLYPTTLFVPFTKNTAGIVGIVILPLLAIAAVTATFVRYMLSVLAGVIYLVAAAVVIALTLGNRAYAPGMNYVQIALLVLMPLLALLWQYARRRTAITRTLLLATPLLLAIVVLLTPANALISRYYAAALPGQLAFVSDPTYQQSAGDVFQFAHKVQIKLPVALTGLDGAAAKDTLAISRVSVQIDSTDGFHYTSPWQPTAASLTAAPQDNQQRPNALGFSLPSSVYDRIAGKQVAVHLILGGTRETPATPYTVVALKTPFPVPHRGSCRLGDTAADPLLCSFPFNSTNNFSLEAETSLLCTVSTGVALPPGALAAHGRAAGFVSPSTGLPSLDPVAMQPVHFQTRGPAQVCPGNKITIADFNETGRGSLHLDLPAIDLGPYAFRTHQEGPMPMPPTEDDATP